MIDFPTDYEAILNRIQNIHPENYSKTRNYIDGDVSYLSPYISRGVISTKFVKDQLLLRGFKSYKIQKFIQELAWRDYWQQVWISKGEAINSDIKHEQHPVKNYKISKAIYKGSTNIQAIDTAINLLYKTGYMHNHTRMYVAALCCNMAYSYWKNPAKWMYYNLLDADWASNALSWQWVAGSNSHKKYVANQENINNFCYTSQTDTFLDITYEAFENFKTPPELKELIDVTFATPLPKSDILIINHEQPTYLFNFYNLDCEWDKNITANRILLLEPSVFKTYPISKKSVDFMLALSKNIANIQVYVGEFTDLINTYSVDTKTIYFKEHPLNKNYMGIEIERDWLFDVQGYFPSFFSYWKKCKKQLTS